MRMRYVVGLVLAFVAGALGAAVLQELCEEGPTVPGERGRIKVPML